MLKRILTSLIGLVVFFAVIFSHRYVLYATVSILALGIMYELYKAMNASAILRITGYVSVLIMSAGYLVGKPLPAIYTVSALFMLIMIFTHGRISSKKVMSVAFATIFVSMFMLTLIMLRRACGRLAVILPFVCAWLTDTGAYFIGSFYGKHKLVPEISPKKTVEGALGGIVFSVIGCIVFYLVLCATSSNYSVSDTILTAEFAFVGFAGSIISQLGDLIASCIKRDCNKKDYGSILPGHGGILDRFDSVIFVTPFIYYAAICLFK
ncbi:MAG: phosphatidate cytidylyltransferase [Firmicutes bacterium]|nr:phosphatidate cytidylyltransferase [Bacillota bacterium]